MKRYRILTDGDKYLIQKRVCFGPINYWKIDRWIEVNDSYPKVIYHKAQFVNIADAERYLSAKLKRDQPIKRFGLFSKPKGWWKVEKQADFGTSFVKNTSFDSHSHSGSAT